MDDVSVEFRPGELVAGVGPTGTGRTTLIDLLRGLLEPTSDLLLADGVVLFDQTMSLWRRELSIVSQDPLLFDQSIRQNLVWSNEMGASDSKIFEALERAGADGFVRQLEKRLGTRVGERGASTNLSWSGSAEGTAYAYFR